MIRQVKERKNRDECLKDENAHEQDEKQKKGCEIESGTLRDVWKGKKKKLR